MDPNKALAELRSTVADAQALIDAGTADNWTLTMALRSVADAAAAMDEWLSKGGFRPAAWEVPINATHPA